MKSWFTSLNGAIVLSALALLSFIGDTLMEMRYFLAKWIPGDSAAMVEIVAILLIVGGWMWALSVARDGRRGGLTALLAFSAFTLLIFLYDLQYLLNPLLPWPEGLMLIVMLIAGAIAVAALLTQLRQRVKQA